MHMQRCQIQVQARGMTDRLTFADDIHANQTGLDAATSAVEVLRAVGPAREAVHDLPA